MDTRTIEVCRVEDMEVESIRRVDHAGSSYAIIRSPEGDFYAIDGWCSHEKSHLVDGMVDGNIIECSRHFGQFDYRTGEAVELPACVNLRTHRIEIRDGKVILHLDKA
jgi:3-phenylpropionate/trans-cinnamate dioxygenase ferredoxin component